MIDRVCTELLSGFKDKRTEATTADPPKSPPRRCETNDRTQNDEREVDSGAVTANKGA